VSEPLDIGQQFAGSLDGGKTRVSQKRAFVLQLIQFIGLLSVE
jgi:hypothetical protein